MAHINNSYEQEPPKYSSFTKPCLGDDNLPYTIIDDKKNSEKSNNMVDMSEVRLDEFKAGGHIRQSKERENGGNKGCKSKSGMNIVWILIGVAAVSAVSVTITVVIQKQDLDNVMKTMKGDVISIIRDTDKGSIWSSWSPWEDCSATCGVGVHRRKRICDDSGQTGTHCEGSDVDMATCNNGVCSGSTWLTWSPWEGCSATCGVGIRRRYRTCDDSEQTGTHCEGSEVDMATCDNGVCSDNCGTNTTLSPGTNCTKFHWCSIGECVEMNCPPDTMYDVNTKLCKPTDHVTCPDAIPVDPFECQKGEICVDLNKTGEITGQDVFSGFAIRKAVTSLVNNKPCSRQAVFKLTFDRAENDTCQSEGFTGRKMLKVQIFLSGGDRSEWMFNIGDSISNNGWAGDGGDSDFSAEIQGVGSRSESMAVYANTKQPEVNCKAKNIYHYVGGLNSSTVSRVTTYIGNRYLKVTNDNGLEDENCNECLWGLAGQYDKRARGEADEDIYVAVNQVVTPYTSRTGYGVCFLKMKWVNNSEE